MFRSRSLIFVVGFLVPLLALIVWFVSAAPNRCNLYRNLGYVYLAKGTLAPPHAQLGTAEAWFSTSLLAECGAASATFGLGQSYAGLGRPLAAISALNDGGDRAELRRFLIGRLDEEMGQEQAAWREYRQLPRDAAAHFYKLANRAEMDGDFQKALHYYSVSTTINPAGSKSFYGAALVYWQDLGDRDGAARMIRQGLAVDRTSSAQRDFYRGLLCYYQGKVDCAVAAWMAAARSPSRTDTAADPRYLAYEMLGRVLVADRPQPGKSLMS